MDYESFEERCDQEPSHKRIVASTVHVIDDNIRASIVSTHRLAILLVDQPHAMALQEITMSLEFSRTILLSLNEDLKAERKEKEELEEERRQSS